MRTNQNQNQNQEQKIQKIQRWVHHPEMEVPHLNIWIVGPVLGEKKARTLSLSHSHVHATVTIHPNRKKAGDVGHTPHPVECSRRTVLVLGDSAAAGFLQKRSEYGLLSALELNHPDYLDQLLEAGSLHLLFCSCPLYFCSKDERKYSRHKTKSSSLPVLV